MIQKTFIILCSIIVLVVINANLSRFDPTPKKHILVIGTAKSGTTAVYTSIKNAMGERLVSYFEPSASDFNAALRSSAKEVLVKLTLIDRAKYKNLYEDIHHFDKQIIVIRDPRDILISNLLYNVRWMRFAKDPTRLKIFLDALREKEGDPSSHSVISLYRLRDTLESEVMQSWESPRSWHDEYNDYAIAVRMIEKNKDLHILHYKDYIDGKLGGLSAYIGTEITGNADVSKLVEKHSHKKSTKNIARSKRYDNWKNWFTAEDITAFRPVFQPLMNKAGYKDDWTLNAAPEINPKHASQYVETITSPQKKQ